MVLDVETSKELQIYHRERKDMILCNLHKPSGFAKDI